MKQLYTFLRENTPHDTILTFYANWNVTVQLHMQLLATCGSTSYVTFIVFFTKNIKNIGIFSQISILNLNISMGQHFF